MQEALSLAIQNDGDFRDNGEKKEVTLDRADIAPNITKVAIEGDLSPKQINKLREKYTKKKKQGEKDIARRKLHLGSQRE